jgi:hypothetical protein
MTQRKRRDHRFGELHSLNYFLEEHDQYFNCTSAVWQELICWIGADGGEDLLEKACEKDCSNKCRHLKFFKW